MAVTYVGKGAFDSGNGAISAAVPAGAAAGDLLLIFVESANETIATPSGWTQVTNSPQSTGTAATAGGVRLAVFWKIHSGSEAAVSIADSGNHTCTIMMAFRGTHQTSPFNTTAGSTQAATTSMVWPAVTTTVANCMIVLACAQDTDAASTTTSGTPTNANLTSLTEQHDQTVATGVGGGLVILTGMKATAGNTGTTTSTGSTSVTHAYLTMALREPAVEFPCKWMPRWAYTDRAFSWTMQYKGSPTSWTITSGALPTGLSLNASSGAITGTATTPGTYTFTLQASDGSTSDTITHTIRVRALSTCDNLQLIRFVGSGTAGHTVPTHGLDLSTGGMIWLIPHTTDNRALIMSADGSTVSDGNLSEFTHTPQTGRVTMANGSFTLPADLNVADRQYTAMVFKKAAGFLDVVTYTGTGAVQIVPHSSGGSSVALALVHAPGVNKGVYGYHGNMGVANKFNLTDGGLNADANGWQQISGTQFTVKALAAHNVSAENYVAAVLAAGAGMLQVGSVTGNASIGGPVINSGGVVPRMILYGGNDNVAANGNRLYALDMQTGLSWDDTADMGRYVRNGVTDYAIQNSFDLSSSQLQVRTADQYANGNTDTYRFVVFADEAPSGSANGDLDLELGSLTSSATATSTITGSSSGTLAALTSSGVGTSTITGAGGGTLGEMTGTAEGTVPAAGELASTFAPLTVVSEGSSAITGELASTLGSLSLSATGTVVTLGGSGTFGDETPGADTFPTSDGRALVNPATLTEDASVIKIWAHFDSTTTAGTSCKGLIYAVNGANPGNLLLSSATGVAIPAGGGWVEMVITGDLAAGTYYIGVVCNSFTAKLTEDLIPGTPYLKMANGTVPYSAPINWPGTTATYEARLSCYVEYTTGAASITGSLTQTLAAVMGSGAGSSTITGSQSGTLSPLTVVAAGSSTITGSSASTLGELTVVATGSAQAAATGTLTQTLGDLTGAGTGTSNVTGTLAQTLALATSSASGTSTVDGDLTATLAPLTGSATATSPIVGQCAAALASLSLSGSATSPISGQTASTLGPVTVSGSGVVTEPGSGTLSQTLANATVSASATSTISGSASNTLGALSSTGAGTSTVTGSSAATLGALTGSSTATSPVRGQTSQALADATLSASGSADAGITGSLTQTLADAQVASSASTTISGSGQSTLGALLSSATGTSRVSGTASQTLSELVLVSQGTSTIRGQSSQTLGQLTVMASGGVVEGRTGTLTQTLAPLTGSSTAVSTIRGQASPTLGALTSTGSGSSTISGAGAGTLTTTLVATGRVLVTAQGGGTLAALTVVASSSATSLGTLTSTLGSLTGTASGIAAARGTLARTMEALSGSATAVSDIEGQAAPTLASLQLIAEGTVVALPQDGQLTQTLAPVQLAASGGVLVQGYLDLFFDSLTVDGSNRPLFGPGTQIVEVPQDVRGIVFADDASQVVVEAEVGTIVFARGTRFQNVGGT